MTVEPLPPDPEAPSHRELIAMARALPEVADQGDHGQLSKEASALLDAFVRHVELERPMVLRLAPITARLVEHGQQRVVDGLVSLVLQADLAEEPCFCLKLATEVASLVEVQIVSEEWDQTPG
jgi:hypothetical protein